MYVYTLQYTYTLTLIALLYGRILSMDAEDKEYEGTCTVRVCVVVVYFRKYGRNMYTRATVCVPSPRSWLWTDNVHARPLQSPSTVKTPPDPFPASNCFTRVPFHLRSLFSRSISFGMMFTVTTTKVPVSKISALNSLSGNLRTGVVAVRPFRRVNSPARRPVVVKAEEVTTSGANKAFDFEKYSCEVSSFFRRASPNPGDAGRPLLAFIEL